jgi:pimeloyl-ACP methyl ester carboxylesterase
MVLGGESEHLAKLGPDGSEEAFRANMPHVQMAHIPGAGHMLHIEQADRVAALVENFLSAH